MATTSRFTTWTPVILLLFVSCATAGQQAKMQSPNDVVATVASVPITLAEVDQKALQQPAGTFGDMKLSQALYEARKSALNDLIGDILFDREAKSRGIERA